MQRVVGDFYSRYQSVLTAHQDRGSYPVNGPIELRITGTDPLDGPCCPRPGPVADHPEWDTVVWLDFATYPGTPGAAPFFRELEQWIWQTYTGSYATVRPEWSKGWAYTDSGPWRDPATLGGTVPAAFDGLAHRPGHAELAMTRHGCSPMPSSTPCCPERSPDRAPHRVAASFPRGQRFDFRTTTLPSSLRNPKR